MTKTVLELKHVHKKIGRKHIINDISFSVSKGEVFGFIGPNGAGKTTTIRMIVGLIKQTSGEIYIAGKSIDKDYVQAAKHIGAIVENPEMYPFMTGMQNLKHFARMTPGVTKERIDEVIKLVKLEKAIHEKVRRYSLGMRQRLGIAQALLHKPQVLILDEPTNGLDPSGMREIREYIRQIAIEDEVAIIISSHLLSEIELMCDRIGIIKNGQLITTKSVHADDGDGQVANIIIEVSNSKKAKQILEASMQMNITATRKEVQFQIDKEKVPTVVKELVTNDIDIYEVSVSKATLEDTFLDLIGENIIE